MKKNILWINKQNKANTNTNMNIYTSISKYEHKYEYLSHTDNTPTGFLHNSLYVGSVEY